MQELEQAYASAAGLYWIAFLLTGHSELSLELTMEVLDSGVDTELLLSSEIPARRRRSVIEKALAAMHDELAVSMHQTAWQPHLEARMPPTWSLDPNTSKLQMENALLAIEIFPRCALLLTIFEGLSLEDASALLGSNRDSVLNGRVTGLWDLTRHLARQQGWKPSATQFPYTSFESNASALSSEP